MATIKKKTWAKQFNLVKAGTKKFDLRMADFKIKKGDTLVMEEYDPKKRDYTGRKISKKVRYVFRFNLNDFGQKKKIAKHGLYIIQF